MIPPQLSSSEIFMFKGIPASPGIAVGKAFLLKEEKITVHRRPLSKDQVKGEITRFQQAMQAARKDIQSNKEKIIRKLGKKHGRLIEAYLLILEDPLLTEDVVALIVKEKVNAEWALQYSIEKIARVFESLENEYLRERRQDLIDIGDRILRKLQAESTEKVSLTKLTGDTIVVAHNLTPTDTLGMREEKVIAFTTDIGGRTSHTAIVAQSLEIPAVVGLKEITAHIKTGDTLIVDGNEGLVIVNPDPLTIENYRREQQIFISQQRELDKLRDLPAQTQDRYRFVLAANIEVPEEIKSVLMHGAEGIGLYRTEYLYLNREDLPTEEEHFQNYKTVAQKMLPYSVIIRTVDLGGDKFKDYLGLGPEANPFLGLRAIRLCLKYPELFKIQLRAILRASVYGKLKIMYPMISGVEELRAANAILLEIKEELKKKGQPFDEKIEVGVMIELPSAAITADVLAKEASFLSIGTNDLIQYTLAVDRINENVASLYDPLHPAILRLLKNIIDAGHAAGKWVGMCGEMAGSPEFTSILIGMGLDEFSVAAIAIPKVKNTIRSLRLSEAKELVKEVLTATDRLSLEAVLKKLRH
ncbi:MAG: phosphoenolpyruvate--protein phosphotransferase [Elusimicrobiota bacterium]